MTWKKTGSNYISEKEKLDKFISNGNGTNMTKMDTPWIVSMIATNFLTLMEESMMNWLTLMDTGKTVITEMEIGIIIIIGTIIGIIITGTKIVGMTGTTGAITPIITLIEITMETTEEETEETEEPILCLKIKFSILKFTILKTIHFTNQKLKSIVMATKDKITSKTGITVNGIIITGIIVTGTIIGTIIITGTTEDLELIVLIPVLFLTINNHKSIVLPLYNNQFKTKLQQHM